MMNRRILAWALTTLALLLTSSATAHAIVPPTSPPPPVVPLIGVVTDTLGAPLPNVQVAIASLRRSTSTDGRGRFAFRSLPSGTYHLDASLLGYAPGHSDVTVPADGDTVSVEIRLRPTVLSLQGVVVTGTPGATDVLRTTQSTTQLAGKELDRDLGATVAQTLAMQPGLQMRYSGPAASTPVIRGMTGDRVLVLQNGQRTGDLSGAAPDHGLSIDPLSATRLEVVRGPASLLYGSGAIGGVVNVIAENIPTTVPGHVDGFVAVQGESVNPGGGATGEATLPIGSALALTARGGFRHAADVRIGDGGTLENTYLRNQHGDLGLGYVGEALTGGLAYTGYFFDYGLPAPAGDPEAGTHIEGHRHQAQGRISLPQPVAWLSDLRLDATGQWYAHDEIEGSGVVGTSFNLKTQTTDLTGRTALGRATGTVGVSGLFRQYVSTGEEALTPAANSNNAGILGFQDLPLGNPESGPHLQAGARYDLYRITSMDGGERFGAGRSLSWNAFSGSLGLNVPISAGLSLSGNIARAFRAPTVEELFSNAFHAAVGSYSRGNADLQPETNLGIEGMLRAQTSRISAEGSVYYNRVGNYIAPLTLGDTVISGEDGMETVPLDVYSQADASLRGAEGKVEYAVAGPWVVGAMGDMVHGEFSDGRPLPYMPPARLGALTRWEPGHLSAEANYRHAFAQTRVSENEAPTGAYDLVGLSVGYSRTLAGRVQNVTFRVDNLLDQRYFDSTSRIKEFAPNPGRNISLVYKVLF